jgi:2-polyprenyl-3-methyl-5-hydroxy-6-metoxy-1,4-benzoquinol methylase
MPFLHNVTRRRLQPEIMDQPDLDVPRHLHALRSLERINWLSGSAGILWPPILALAQRISKEPLRILDIATGGGDVPVRLWGKARRAGLNVQIAGCDRSPVALDYARQRALGKTAPIVFFACDVLEGELPNDYDILTSSLFLHHLDEERAVTFLQRLTRAARHLVLVNDLVRSWTGYALACLGTRILTTSAVVHTDGPRSVEGAFTIDEVRTLASRAGLEGATVARRWPCRYLLLWSRA